MKPKTFVFALLLALTVARFVDKYPDALRCGINIDRGAMYFAHQVGDKSLAYCQVWASEPRCVIFNLNGVYQSGSGHAGSRDGCTGKSIADLEDEGRAFDIEDSKKIKQLEARIKKLEESKINDKGSNCCSSFWDYEQVKQKWYSDFEATLLQKIKTNGLEIGRWRVLQETTYFVIRDVEGSKTKDSRIAFPAGSYLDPK